MKITYIIIGLGLILIGYLSWQRFGGDNFDIPADGDTNKETIVVEDGQLVGQSKNNMPQDDSTGSNIEDNNDDQDDQKINEPDNTTNKITKEIMVTDGVRHSIVLEEVLQGCPRKDCIPSIDEPEFEDAKKASAWLDDEAPGIAYSQDGVNRFYPYDILVSHEIVNDTVNGQRVLISYCPLCLTAVVYDPLVQGEWVEFGVSGLLWKSNLIMYDRKTDTRWSQVLGEAVMGELTGTELTILPSDQMLFGNWRKKFASGEVLRGGVNRGGNPYAASHFDVSGTALSFAHPTDERLPFGTHVFGILVNGKAKAYPVNAIKEKWVVTDTFEGKNIELRYLADLDVVRIYDVLPDGTQKRINPLSGFWFSWAEAHPETELYE